MRGQPQIEAHLRNEKARISHIKGSSALFPHAHSQGDIPAEQKQRHRSPQIERAKRLSTTLKEGTAKTFFTNLAIRLEGTLESLKLRRLPLRLYRRETNPHDENWYIQRSRSE